jgi:hypothetical protein
VDLDADRFSRLIILMGLLASHVLFGAFLNSNFKEFTFICHFVMNSTELYFISLLDILM